MTEFSKDRTFAVTPKGDRDTLLDTLEVTVDEIEDMLDRVVEMAREQGKELDIHAHNQWWAASYTVLPDGRVWYHATGRKNGWIR